MKISIETKFEIGDKVIEVLSPDLFDDLHEISDEFTDVSEYYPRLIVYKILYVVCLENGAWEYCCNDVNNDFYSGECFEYFKEDNIEKYTISII